MLRCVVMCRGLLQCVGGCCGVSWVSCCVMFCHGVLWCIVGCRKVSWCVMRWRGVLWSVAEDCSVLQGVTGYHRVSRCRDWEERVFVCFGHTLPPAKHSLQAPPSSNHSLPAPTYLPLANHKPLTTEQHKLVSLHCHSTRSILVDTHPPIHSAIYS